MVCRSFVVWLAVLLVITTSTARAYEPHVSFKDKEAETLFKTRNASKRLGPYASAALRKLVQVRATTRINDLASPPGNQLEKLGGADVRQIRIERQHRVRFRWDGKDAHDVERRLPLMKTATVLITPTHPGDVLRVKPMEITPNALAPRGSLPKAPFSPRSLQLQALSPFVSPEVCSRERI